MGIQAHPCSPLTPARPPLAGLLGGWRLGPASATTGAICVLFEVVGAWVLRTASQHDGHRTTMAVPARSNTNTLRASHPPPHPLHTTITTYRCIDDRSSASAQPAPVRDVERGGGRVRTSWVGGEQQRDPAARIPCGSSSSSASRHHHHHRTTPLTYLRDSQPAKEHGGRPGARGGRGGPLERPRVWVSPLPAFPPFVTDRCHRHHHAPYLIVDRQGLSRSR